jgi:hypothetical protein
MPAAFNEIGVKCVTAALVESVDVQKQLEHKIIKKSDGGFETGNRYDPSFSFSVKGRGVADESLLGGASAAYVPEQITGGTTIITTVKNSQTNEDYNSFELSGVNHPAAGAA